MKTMLAAFMCLGAFVCIAQESQHYILPAPPPDLKDELLCIDVKHPLVCLTADEDRLRATDAMRREGFARLIDALMAEAGVQELEREDRGQHIFETRILALDDWHVKRMCLIKENSIFIVLSILARTALDRKGDITEHERLAAIRIRRYGGKPPDMDKLILTARRLEAHLRSLEQWTDARLAAR